ncbi:hypothetical protein OKA04_22165 [Luteolibacter flavescens]|uniref:Uncharacterized protein n=1 Tax=Luteolibacter flavescens TaxID=1859460 RepID=A0ABT3FV61_9BACT|nr:hypothetical protein [Luteolibacter flavescens]MCW1887457.1 hypothetical protein [Luteolibacter flavescens]
MNSIPRSAFLALACALVIPAGGAVVSINFVGNAGANGSLAATDTAGVVAATHWNNVTQSGVALVDGTGAASAITATFTVGGWSSGIVTTETADKRMMKGYLDVGGGNTTVTLNNLNPALTYRIYLYSDGENTYVDAPVARTGTFTIGTVATGITDAPGEQFEGTFRRVYPGTTGEGNYTVVTVTGSASYVIQARGTAADATDNVFRAPINGIQIETVE